MYRNLKMFYIDLMYNTLQERISDKIDRSVYNI